MPAYVRIQIYPGHIVNLNKTGFTDMLMAANDLDPLDFQSWAVCPGMLFQSPRKWWGDRGRRDFPHEGIDLCLYANRSGRILRLDHTTRIPAMHAGVVRAIFTDYLGKAVIIEHESAVNGSGKLVSAYAHTIPREGLRPGAVVAAGDVIATIADTSGSKAKIAPHLHYTIGTPSPDLAYENFVWNHMRNPDMIALLDPLKFIDRPLNLLDRKHRCCLEL